MAEGYIETKGAVQTFLQDLKSILINPELDFRLMPREDKEYEYTTEYCLEILSYNTNDVINELLSLTVKDYVETCDDLRNKKVIDFMFLKKQ